MTENYVQDSKLRIKQTQAPELIEALRHKSLWYDAPFTVEALCRYVTHDGVELTQLPADTPGVLNLALQWTGELTDEDIRVLKVMVAFLEPGSYLVERDRTWRIDGNHTIRAEMTPA